jgi:putative acetyltransferase
MHAVIVRNERAGDEAAIRRVNDAAFGQSDESRIVDSIRRTRNDVISLVAVSGDAIVGHILFTPVAVESADADELVMGLGPLAVQPEFQRMGIGSRLVREGLQACTRAGCGALVVVGHSEYYPRFGFRPASTYGLRCEYDVADDVFMAMELVPGALAQSRGLVRYVPEFR